MPGIRAASLPRAPLPGTEPFPGADDITKGFSAHSPPPRPGQLLAAGWCSRSQWQEQLKQALASVSRLLLQMLPCAPIPLRVLGFRTVPVPLWPGSPHQSVQAEDGLSLTPGLSRVKAQKKCSRFCF